MCVLQKIILYVVFHVAVSSLMQNSCSIVGRWGSSCGELSGEKNFCVTGEQNVSRLHVGVEIINKNCVLRYTVV
jgi:hypothetical protein